MIVLDTNVLSALMQTRPEDQISGWLNNQPKDSVWTTTISVFEVRSGLLSMVKGRRQKALEAAFEMVLDVELERRILDLNTRAAEEAALIAVRLRQLGRPIDVRDAMIAGIVAARSATLATRNTKHFANTPAAVVNPWTADLH